MSDESPNQTLTDSSVETKSILLQGFADIKHDDIRELIEVTFFKGSDIYHFDISFDEIINKEIFVRNLPDGTKVHFIKFLLRFISDARLKELRKYTSNPLKPLVKSRPQELLAYRSAYKVPVGPPKEISFSSIEVNHINSSGDLSAIEALGRPDFAS